MHRISGVSLTFVQVMDSEFCGSGMSMGLHASKECRVGFILAA